MTRATKVGMLLLAGLLNHTSPAAAAEITVVDGVVGPGVTVFLIRGEILPGDDERFYQMAQMAPIATVALDSPGGSVDTGISIGAEIAIRGFETVVLNGHGCHSICAVMWVSGAKRYMSPDSNISVHAAYRSDQAADGTGAYSESGVGNAKIGAYLNELGLTAQAIAYFTTARPDQPLLPITPEIAQALDIDVHVLEDDGIITPADRPTPRRITRQVAELSMMAGSCSEILGLQSARLEATASQVLRNGHELFGGERFGELIPEFIATTKARASREGTVRWCITAEANLRNDGIQTGVTGPSFDCAAAQTPTEMAICNSQDLWTMDRAVSNLYFLFRAAAQSAQRSAYLDSQRSWLKRRDECGADPKCLIERYSSRLFDLGF